jgi:rare lipoprotein A
MNRLRQRKLVAGVSLSCMAGVLIMGFTTQSAPAPSSQTEVSSAAVVYDQEAQDETRSAGQAKPKPVPDLSGRMRVGKASFYADRFGGRKMANGRRMNLKGDNAASRTLPLGTTAKVTNLKTGLSTLVTIQDRGPYVDGRMIDLSPGTAAKIGLTRKEGLTKVEVSPVAVPLPNGRIKLGVAADDPQIALNLMTSRAASGGGS